MSVLISLMIFLMLLAFVGIGLLRGRRNHPTYSWMRLAAAALSVVLSAVAAIFASRGLVTLLVSVLPLGSVGEILRESDVLAQGVCALLAMLLAPALFVIFFFIVKALLGIAVRRIARTVIQAKQDSHEAEKEAEASDGDCLRQENDETAEPEKKLEKKKKFAILRTEKANAVGMLCGALCGLLICLVWLSPIVGTISVADDAIGLLAGSSKEPAWDTVDKISDDVADSAGVRTLRVMGADAVYSLVTAQPIGGGWASLPKETEFLSAVGSAVAATRSTEIPRAEAAQAWLALEETFEETQWIPTVLSDTLGAANQKWERGERFCGIAKPSVGGSALSGIIDPALKILATGNADTMKDDVGTIAHVMAMMIEQDALTGITADPLQVFENQELSESVIYELLCNEHLSPLVGELSEFGIELVGQKMGADLQSVEMDTSSIQDKRAEAGAIASAFGKAIGLMHAMEGDSAVDGDMIRSVGPVLDAFAATEMAGKENSDVMLKGLLESERIYTNIGYTKEESSHLADTINDKANKGGYQPLMVSLGQTIDVVKMSSSDDKNTDEMDRKIEEMMQDLTPESAEVLQTASTPGMMTNRGVPDRSAEPTSEMVSSMFGNLSAAKENGMSEEEYRYEAKATTNMLNLAMSAGKSENGMLFGEGSATGKSADEFVNDVFSSKVISQTMVETVYADGGESAPAIDPLNSQRVLKDTERQELLGALNNQWSAATEEQRADASYQKQYVAMASMMNLTIQITDGGIVAE